MQPVGQEEFDTFNGNCKLRKSKSTQDLHFWGNENEPFEIEYVFQQPIEKNQMNKMQSLNDDQEEDKDALIDQGQQEFLQTSVKLTKQQEN